ncbi:hypothetical protein HMPREF1584_01408 [Gardnerella vaginalis JCP8481A]|nr:hypothetical protein HMPREF1584_01408 [Gardnerella vaginalis JCP8481A]
MLIKFNHTIMMQNNICTTRLLAYNITNIAQHYKRLRKKH